MGVRLRLGTRLGRDVQLEELRREFAAVFLALGAQKSLSLQIPGESLAGVIDALDFLKASNCGHRPEIGPRVAVIGGGNAAIDCSRMALRAGAESVQVLYRRTEDLMPALASEVAAARAEGVGFQFLVAPRRILGERRVSGLMLQRTELAPDAGGRLCPAAQAGSEFTLEVDTVIPAVGQTADFNFFGPGLAFDTATIHRLKTDEISLETQIPGVFAGGDLATGPRSVVAAMAAGRRAALAIHARLQQEQLPADLPPLTGRTTDLYVTTDGVPPAPRQAMAHLAGEERLSRGEAEVALGYSGAEARAEADRCLGCTCSQCIKSCPFLQRYATQFPETPKELAGRLAAASEGDAIMAYSCHYCGLCQAVCPKNLHVGELCLQHRQRLVVEGRGPLPQHKGVQDYVRWGTSPIFTLIRPDPATGKTERVFFPGCALSGRHPQLVKAAYAYLRERLPDTGIMFNCCGAPSLFLGETPVFEQILATVAAELKKLGAGEIIAACPHCLYVFGEFLPEIKVRSIYEVIAELGVPLESKGRGAVFNVHDACGTRHNPRVQEAVRRVLALTGHSFEEMAHSRERSICCGSGGMVPAVAPELARQTTALRLAEASRDLITYCAACRARFAAAGHPALHVLDLVFNPGWERAKTTPPAGSLTRWWRRWRLKKYFERK